MTDGPVWIQQDHENLLTITLNRQEKANALTPAMLDALTVAVHDAARARVKAVILTGRGRVFSAGADLDHAAQGLARSPAWATLSNALAALPCLKIAALNGTLAGGAFGMALACDIRIAALHAHFFYPVMRLGYLPPQPDPARLVTLIGPARASMILTAGARIDASEALAWGLIDRIVPESDLLDAAKGLCAHALAAQTDHVAAIGQTIRDAVRQP